MKHERLSFWFAALVLMLAGCTAYPKRVDCEGHLHAINAPAPAVSKDAVP